MRSGWLYKFSLIFGHRLRHNWFLLCFFSILVLVALLSSSSSTREFESLVPPRLPNVYTNYRKLKEQSVVDYFDLRFLASLANPRQKELPLCGKERENYVPCYNLSANLEKGLKDGEEFDRHCELSNEEKCLVRPPKEYKIPLRWPAGRDVIWSGNVKITKDQFLSSGSMTKRMMLLEENQIAFHNDDGLIFDGVKDYTRQLAESIGLGSDSDFLQAGVHTVLDIGCGFGSFGAHLVSLRLMPVCIAAYEVTGSQVQLALERGLPAMIGNFISKQLPYPSLSFDMIHCAQCGIDWDGKDGMFIIEVDRLLKPGGYFVLTSPLIKPQGSLLTIKKGNMLTPVEDFTQSICWSLLDQQDETFIWQKTADKDCYAARRHGLPLCQDEHESQSYYNPLVKCISGTHSKRWTPIRNKSNGSRLTLEELEVHGIQHGEFYENKEFWKSALRNYWSLLTPLIFSDHPKRPGDEDPLPPYNMVRNVMDMNAYYGGFNAALVDLKKSAWVLNVVPVGTRNTLPLILDQGFAGVLHDWCEPFPTYPRTYDMIHASGLFSLISSEKCSMMNLFLEMDRILRPEGWVILSDNVGAIEMARTRATQIRWEARVIDPQNGSDQRILVCQKPFLRK
ncbi:probable methyltransferase PMT5 [Amaranthus tricolor]|uniref:probable methyltransferase PMT5 n=1 Tax=Amaranthus tricolor TaxID=29722 RepID=UPI00258324F4|nr:probable methyltransferase PMT5 [Amaranthus tricolor]XP_057531061.1 probable methyltransferase PMT5 [Amaranthus tricolor]